MSDRDDDQLPLITTPTSHDALLQQVNMESLLLTGLVALHNKKIDKKSKKAHLIRIGKYLLYLMALNAGLPYIQPATELFAPLTLKIYCGISTYSALGSVSVWSVRDYLYYLSLIESNASNKYIENGIMMLSFVLGVISSLPGGLITLKYNSIAMLPFSIFLDVSTNTTSFNLFFRQAYNDQFAYRKFPKTKAARNFLIRALEFDGSNRTFPSDMTKENVLEEICIALEYSSTILETEEKHVRHFGLRADILRIIFAMLLPLSWEIITCYLVYQDMQNTLDFSPSTAMTTGLFTTLPTYFLEYIFASTLFSIIYDYFSHKYYRNQITNPAFQYHFWQTSLALGLMCTLIIFSFAGRAKVTVDVLSDGILKIIALSTACVGTLFFKVSALSSNVIAIQNYLMTQRTQPMSCYQRVAFFQVICTKLKTASPQLATHFLKALSIFLEQRQTNQPAERIGETHFIEDNQNTRDTNNLNNLSKQPFGLWKLKSLLENAKAEQNETVNINYVVTNSFPSL